MNMASKENDVIGTISDSRPECLVGCRDERGCGKRFWKRKSVRFGFRSLFLLVA